MTLHDPCLSRTFSDLGGFAVSVNGDAARRDMWAGRIERCLAADMTVKEWYALNKVAESSLCKWMARFREEEPRPLFPQVERGVELDEGHASRPRAAALQARSPLPIRWKGDGWHLFRGEEIDDEALESLG